MQLIGSAKLRVAVWDIYKAELFSVDQQFQLDEPHVLKLRYLRDFKSTQLVKETQKQLRKVSDVNSDQLEVWSTALSKIWPNVSKGDALVLHVDSNNDAHFYLNSSYLGVVSDKGFSKAFSGIWLSEKSTRPKLRNALLGQS
jgi:sulfur relay (sulfurtransferase) DsrC/TusE family protein